MDFRRHLLDLVAPLAEGDEISPGVRFIGTSTELGLRLSFATRAGELHVELAALDERRPHAARSRHLSFAYRHGGPEGAVDTELGLALCRALAERVAAREGAVLAAVADAARAERAATNGGDRVREVRVEKLLEAGGSGATSSYTLSPYVGCLVGCRFCYAQGRVASVRRLERASELAWGSYVDARTNAPEVLAEELRRLPPRPLKFCPIVSDPYQPIEARLGLTRRCLETIRDAEHAWATLVLTRTTLVLRDLDVLAEMPAAWVGASIPTIDDEARAHFEPRAASVADRLATLARLRAAGVRTFAVVQPVLPGPIEPLADALARTVASVSIDVLHGVEGAGADFDDPRFSHARADAWQRERAARLSDALAERGVPTWGGELPPELLGASAPRRGA